MGKEKEAHPIRNGIIATVVGSALLSLWPAFRTAIAKFLFWLLELATTIRGHITVYIEFCRII